MFSKMLPALTIANQQICIPDTYYAFPGNGNMYVDIALESPTHINKRRFIVAKFSMIDGQPHTPKRHDKGHW
ncbi:hypothetical protein ACGVWS_12580 [Enterobacteriaceae bacterium LUAb1]